MRLYPINPYRRRFGQLGSIFTDAAPAALSAPSGSIASQAQETVQAQTSAVVSTAPVSPIVDESGTVVILTPDTGDMSIAGQVAAASNNASALQPTPAELEDAAAITLMHQNSTLSSNASPYLASGVIDAGAVGAAPTYVALPHYDSSNNPAGVDFPYMNPAPHWTTNLKWWTGQTLLNVGVPQYENDPWEYLRSALVDTNISMLQLWVAWYFAAMGKGNTVYSPSQPWAQALQNLDLAQLKYIYTSEGPVFLPFSYADLTALQQGTAQWEYGYDPGTLATMLSTWVSQVLPDVSQFDISVRLDPATNSPPRSPYPSNFLPALYHPGSTLLAQIAPYLGVATLVLSFGVGVLTGVLAAGSGVGAPVADTTSSIATGGISVDTGALSAGDALSDALEPISVTAETVAGGSVEVLPELTSTAIAPTVSLTAGATTALTAAAAAGASVPTLEEIDVTAQTYVPDTDNLTGADLTVGGNLASDVAESAAQAPQINYPSNTPLSATNYLKPLLTGIAKLFGGSGEAGTASDSGLTGTDGNSLGDWLGSLSSTEWLALFAAGAAGLYFIHESRPKRKRHT